MSYAIRLLIASALLAGCTKEKRDPSDVGDDDDDDDIEVCEQTSECGDEEACIDNVCTDSRNDSIEDADFGALDSWISGFINPAGDIDVYEFEIDEPAWVRVNTKTNTSDCTQNSTESNDRVNGLDTVVKIRAANGAEHAVMNDYPTGPVSVYDSVLHAYIPEAGKWYVTVEDVSTWVGADPRGDATSAFDYCLEVSTSGAAATRETDDFQNPSISVDISQAGSTWSVGVLLEQTGDSDWMTIDLPYEGPLEIWGQPTIPGSDAVPHVRLHDPVLGEVVLELSEIAGDDVIGYYFNGLGQRYVLEATDTLGGGGDDFWYVLYFRTQDELSTYQFDRELEPNDDDTMAWEPPLEDDQFSNGTPFKEAEVLGTLDPADDEDWYQVAVASDEYLHIICAGQPWGAVIDFSYEVYDSDATTILDEQADGNEVTWDITAPSAGVKYVRIFSPTGTYGQGAYYTCDFWTTKIELDP